MKVAFITGVFSKVVMEVAAERDVRSLVADACKAGLVTKKNGKIRVTLPHQILKVKVYND